MVRPDSESILEYMIPWQALPWPLNLNSHFGRSAECVLEIGYGDGEFLCDLASRDPERNHFGIELAWKPTKRLFRRLDNRSLKNIRVVTADAHLVVERMLQSSSIAECFINHPDPWRKERHHGRRLIQADFLRHLARILVPGGRLTIATDHAGYAEWITDVLENQPWFTNELATTSVPELPDRIVTRYERKARAQGIGNSFFVWRNATEPAPERPVEETLEMPNVIMQCGEGVDLESILCEAVPRVIQDSAGGVDVVINMVRVFAERGAEQSWMVETLVREGRLTQHLTLLVIRHDEDRLTVKTSPVGFPRGTWGVKRAVRELAGILDAADGLRVLHSTVA